MTSNNINSINIAFLESLEADASKYTPPIPPPHYRPYIRPWWGGIVADRDYEYEEKKKRWDEKKKNKRMDQKTTLYHENRLTIRIVIRVIKRNMPRLFTGRCVELLAKYCYVCTNNRELLTISKIFTFLVSIVRTHSDYFFKSPNPPCFKI
jgi:hypothetical protein